MLPFLFPVGLLGVVVLVSVFDQISGLVGASLMLLVAPFLWRARFGPGDDPDADVNYWRIRRR